MKGHPLRKESLAWAGALLDACLHGHPSCPSEDMTILPRRILVLEPQPGSDEIAVRLQETHSPTKAHYATLSHCWGAQQTCVTTTMTLQSHLQGIPWNELPKTFRDSISYCVKLHIRYLWIDALCIVQDDPAD